MVDADKILKADLGSLTPLTRISGGERKTKIPESPIGFINIDEEFTIDKLLKPLNAFGDDFEGGFFMKDLLGRIGEYILDNVDQLGHYRISYNIMSEKKVLTMRFAGGEDAAHIYNYVADLIPSLKTHKVYAEGRTHINRFGPHLTIRVMPPEQQPDYDKNSDGFAEGSKHSSSH